MAPTLFDEAITVFFNVFMTCSGLTSDGITSPPVMMSAIFDHNNNGEKIRKNIGLYLTEASE
jgi:hypothetical protein